MGSIHARQENGAATPKICLKLCSRSKKIMSCLQSTNNHHVTRISKNLQIYIPNAMLGSYNQIVNN